MRARSWLGLLLAVSVGGWCATFAAPPAGQLAQTLGGPPEGSDVEAAPPLGPPPAVGVTNEQITDSLTKAVAWIYSKQNDAGNWESGPVPAGTKHDLADQGQFGGYTALALRALLEAGENPRSPQLQKAIHFLLTNPNISGVYAVGLRAECWPLLPTSPEIKTAMLRDRGMLLSALHHNGASRGLYSFKIDYETAKESAYGDHSVSMYGTLGVKALADAGMEIPEDYWNTVDAAWRMQQQDTGSWTFRVGARRESPTMNMTASGVAVLFATSDELSALRPADCTGLSIDTNIEAALAWMDQHFEQSHEVHKVGGLRLVNYALYAVARIGVDGGVKFFGQRDWYQDGAQFLLSTQNANDGSWGNLADTCFGVLFLERGRNPVLLNKLQYDVIYPMQAGDPAPATKPAPRTPPGKKPKAPPRGIAPAKPPPLDGKAHEANWNERPRDAANVIAWTGREFEREFNWQTVTLKVSADQLHDSALLYLSGNQTLDMTDEDKAKLKLYIEQGGIIVGNADCASHEFADSFRKLGQELFPDYEFRNVPKDSILYTAEQYRANKWKDIPAVMELHNGVRDLMVLVPEADPGKAFQLHQAGAKDELYQLYADLIFYSVDQTGERLKGESYIVLPDPKIKADKTIKVARLKYDGNWDPEPGGWDRLSAVLHNGRKTDLNIVPITPGEGKLDHSFKIAHLTGTAKFHLSDEAQAELKAYVQGGGTLVVDAAGGSRAFDAAAQGELKAIFPDASLDVLQYDHPAYNASEKIPNVAYRRFARPRLGQNTSFRLQGIDIGNRTAVVYSAEDMTEGLVGEPIDGIYGYTPAIATKIMANLVMDAAKR